MEVKYLFKSFKRAQLKDCLNEYLFFLQLKSLDNKGKYYRKSYLGTIHLPYSKSYISTMFKKLVKKGFIKQHSSYYELISIYGVWRKLGFRFKHKTYCERHRYESIPSNHLTDKATIKAFITTLEIAKNQAKQLYKETQPIVNKIHYHDSTLQSTKSLKIQDRKRVLIRELTETLNNYTEGSSSCKTVSRISNKRISKILGYKTTMSGWNLVKKACQEKFLTSTSKLTLLLSGVKKRDFYQDLLNQFENCFWMYGRVYKRECTEINIDLVLHNIKQTTSSLLFLRQAS